MKISVVYSSKTGNTKLLAEAVKDEINDIIYFGEAGENVPDSDLYFIGSWTDKGTASEEILNFIKTLKNKKISFFGTAGFGGSADYYEKIFDNVKSNIDSSNEILGSFYCQGKMPEQVRMRYLKLLSQNPDDERLKLSLENFDRALSHPDKDDIENIKRFVKTCLLHL